MVWWVREDCCGVFCGFMTIFLLCYAAFVQCTFVIGPGLGYFHPLTLFYIFITFMAAFSHAKTQFTNPGAVPLNNDQLIQLDQEQQHAPNEIMTTSNSEQTNLLNKTNTSSHHSSNINNNNNNNIDNKNGININNHNHNHNDPHSHSISSQNGGTISHNSISSHNSQPMSVVTHKQTDPISRRKQLMRYFNEMQIQARWCDRCKQYKPSEAHHCSTCNRCIIKMDHHCPWVNNCVAMMNQKFFVLFLFYTCLCCIFCLISLITRFISCNHKVSDHDHHRSRHRGETSHRRSSDNNVFSHGRRHNENFAKIVNDAATHNKEMRSKLGHNIGIGGGHGGGGSGNNRMLFDISGNIEDNGNDNINGIGNIQDGGINGGIDELEIVYGDWCSSGGLDVMFCMLNMFEGILFGLFTCIMSCDQISSIMNNVTYIDSIQMRRHGNSKSKNKKYDDQKKLTGMDNLAFIFGEKFGIRWFLPLSHGDKIRQDFRQLCSKFE